MRADDIARGRLEGQPAISHVVSIEVQDNGRTVLSFHAGNTKFVALSRGAVETSSFEGSTLEKTRYGFKGDTQVFWAANKGGVDSIVAEGTVRRVYLEQIDRFKDDPINLFVNDELVASGTELEVINRFSGFQLPLFNTLGTVSSFTA